MGYVLGFGLMLIGYTLIDWGHYAVKGESVSMWYLLSGRTSPITPTTQTQATAGTATLNKGSSNKQ